MKAFKYFDLNDNGVVEPDEFAKAIEKIGIQIPTKSVSYYILFNSIFEMFDYNYILFYFKIYRQFFDFFQC